DVHGVSMTKIMNDPAISGHPAIAYRSKATTIRTDRYRMIEHSDGHIELYDHQGKGESTNVADTNAATIKQLRTKLEKRLELKR
ncbi:MAG: iduronate-2-sulfatase, partial [Planctomycetota bacterium]